MTWWYQRTWRLSESEQKEVNIQISSWLNKDIIQSSRSDYASPIVSVKKKNNTTRICIDYRKLNEKIIKMRYPLPIIEDQTDRLQKARIIHSLWTLYRTEIFLIRRLQQLRFHVKASRSTNYFFGTMTRWHFFVRSLVKRKDSRNSTKLNDHGRESTSTLMRLGSESG